MNKQANSLTSEAAADVPSSVLELLRKMDPKQRQELLNSLLQNGNQRLGIYNRDQNVFFQFI